MPTLVEGTLGFTFSWHHVAKLPNGGTPPAPYQLRIHIYPRVVLWNPYNVEIMLDRTMVMIQGNGRQEMLVKGIVPPKNNSVTYGLLWAEGGRNTSFTPGNFTGSDGYKDPYIGGFYFSLPKTTFKPGECLVFSPEKGAEYERPIDGGTGIYSLEKNILSCETSPDPSKNYYVSNDEGHSE